MDSRIEREDVLRLLRRAKTMVLATQGESGVWATKVFYALDRGFVFLLEKDGRTLRNIMRNPRVAFTVDLDKPDLYVQGEGVVEILGDPSMFDEERGALLWKVPEDALFVSMGHVVIARLKPDYLVVGDLRGAPRRYEVRFDPSELVEVRRAPLLRAARYWSFQMSLASLIVGSLLAPLFNPWLFIIAAVALVAVHASFNVFNDYFDFVKGIDKPTSLGSSGSRVLVDGIAKPWHVFNFALALLAVGLGLGIYLILLRPVILPLVILGLIMGILYSAPRISLKDNALGDLAVFLAFGPGIVLGADMLQGGTPNIAAVLLSTALGFLIVDVLHANNWRDIRTDTSAGIRTIASILGERGSMIYYLVLLWSAYPITVVSAYLLNDWLLLVSLASIPMAISLTKIAITPRHFRRWVLDQLTGRFTIVFAILLIIGLILRLVIP